MTETIKKMSTKPLVAWGLFFLIYIIFIFVFSYLYPYGADEYILKRDTLWGAIASYFQSYMSENARIGLLANNIILYLGKWSFLILNPLVQIVWLLSFFALVYLRLPDFNKLSDFPSMLLIALLSVFAVAQPDNTLFWIGGACNYSWSALPFFWILTWLRLEYKAKGNLNLSKKYALALFFIALALGMSSENSGPLTMGLIVCFAAAFHIAALKLKKHFWLIALGLALGIGLLFGAPAMWNRLNTDIFDYFNNSSLRDKLLWHISHIHFYIKAMFLIPAITFIALLICSLDRDKPERFKNENYILAVIFAISSWILAAVLFAIPLITGRCFYTASVAALISFLFTLIYLREAYKFQAVKYCAMLAFAWAVAFTPVFAYPYLNLHRQDEARANAIAQAKESGAKTVFLIPYKYLKGPNDNLTIMFYDPVFGFLGYANYLDMAIQTDIMKEAAYLYIFSNPNVI